MSSTTAVRRAARQGVVDLAPIALGMAPFGLLAGIAAVEAGLAPWAGSIFSTVVFAGAAQLAALELIGDGAPAAVVIGTILVINTRFVMYSASLAPHLVDKPLRHRAVVAYLLTDQAYAVSINRLTADPAYEPRVPYIVAGAGSLWAAWNAYTIAGALLGAALPPDVPIDFAIPLVFAALLVPATTDRPTLAAAVTSGAVATLGRPLPSNLGLLAGAAAGIIAGVVVAGRAAAEEVEA